LGNGTTADTSLAVLVAGGVGFDSVRASIGRTCAVTGAGVAYCWGSNTGGLLAVSDTASLVLMPSAVVGGQVFSRLEAGADAGTACGLTPAGDAYCWGGNGWGQLGDGTTTDRTAPTLVSGGLSFGAIAVGGQHTCGITTAGAAYCWGLNSSGQLGSGSTTDSHVPSPVSGGLAFRAITAGDEFTCALATDQRLYCWGANFYGQVADGTTQNRSVPTRLLYQP
jgi:alpha-tubulin suppressor-like RCC1 family protein